MAMDYRLRSYAHVRTHLHKLKKARSDIASSVQSVPPPIPFTKPLAPIYSAPEFSGPADLLIRNARIFPRGSTDDQDVVVTIKGKYIAYIGPDTGGLTDGNTTVIDAQGNSVIPGLCDSHLHLMVGSEHNQGCDVEDIRDPDELLKRLRTFVKEHPDNRVYYVYGLHYTAPPLLPAKEARKILDSIVSDKPLFVYAHDLHTGWCNTRALHEADLMHPMPPYPGLIRELGLEGNVELDRDGFPGGELREPPVYFIVEEALRRQYPLTLKEKKRFVEEACQALAAKGLTSIHNMGLDLPEEDIECLLLLLELEADNRLPLRVHSSCSVVPDEMMLSDVMHAADVRDHLEKARRGEYSLAQLHQHLLHLVKKALDMRQAEKGHKLWDRFINDFSHVITAAHISEHEEHGHLLKINRAQQQLDPIGKVQCKAVKLFMDGVVEKDTAFRLDHHPVQGIPAFLQRELDLVMLLADRLGLQVAAHCIGNGAVNAMLNAAELARQKNADIDRQRGARVRHRIEHIEMCNAYDIPRFAELDVIASMQALHERPPTTMWHEKVPENQWPTAFAWKSLLETGATLVFGSDWPIVSCNDFEGIQRATSRTPWKPGMPDQHLSLNEALQAFSTSAARAEYTEAIKGTLRQGMLADLVILSENVATRKDDFDQVQVACTISDGQVVYTAS
jgi:predicted amidohydrolase YtcJ